MLNANNNFYQSMLSNKQGFGDEYPKDDNLTPAKLVEKSITENGEYSAKADNADGYSKVNVNVAGGGGETFEVEITISGTVSDTNRTFTTSKTIQETIDAIKARKQIDFSATWNGREGEVICYGVYNMGVGEAILMIVFDSTSVYPIYWMGDEDVWSRNQTPFMIAGIQT